MEEGMIFGIDEGELGVLTRGIREIESVLSGTDRPAGKLVRVASMIRNMGRAISVAERVVQRERDWDADREAGRQYRELHGWTPPVHCGACGGNNGAHTPHCVTVYGKAQRP